MKITDALKILGLAQDATTSEIKRVYKKLALEFHPDRNPGDPEAERRFRQIVIAHETLKNPKRYSPGRLSRGRRSARPKNEYEEKWEDIFSHIFRSAHEPAGEKKSTARDLNTQVEVTFEELTRDVEKEITISRSVRCVACRGRGTAPGTQRSACPTCKGTGEIRYRQGLAELRIPCSACDGSGKHEGEACPDCRGEGRNNRREKLSVKVPAAMEEGTQIRMKSKGHENARTGEAGDLIVTVRVKPHSLFRRKGNDILLDLPVSFSQAALGHETLVPTLKEARKFRIPAGTQSGREFLLKGEGLAPAGGRNTGDMRIRVLVETPTKLDEHQRAILARLQRISSLSNHPRTRTFHEKTRFLLE